jgi:tRNA dimethylallyltransferase
VKHHLIDVADVRDSYSLAQYQRAAYRAIDGIAAAGKLPFLVGGTGLYLSAVMEGYQLVEVPPNRPFREELERLSPGELLERLKRLDSGAAQSIDPANPRRLVRAIEVATAGYSSSDARKTSPRYVCLRLGLMWPRAVLVERIERRLQARLDQGMIEEVAELRANGVSDERLEKLGLEYRYIARYLRGELGTRDELFSQLSVAIRQFAKDQLTWFKRDSQIVWLDPFKDCFEQACLRIRDWRMTADEP